MLLLHRAALRALFQVQLVTYCVRMCARVQCTSSKTDHLGTATAMARQDPLIWGPFSQGCTKTDVASGLSLGSPAKSFTSKSWGPMQRSQNEKQESLREQGNKPSTMYYKYVQKVTKAQYFTILHAFILCMYGKVRCVGMRICLDLPRQWPQGEAHIFCSGNEPQKVKNSQQFAN